MIKDYAVITNSKMLYFWMPVLARGLGLAVAVLFKIFLQVLFYFFRCYRLCLNGCYGFVSMGVMALPQWVFPRLASYQSRDWVSDWAHDCS